jgi:hypothetical protein
MLVTNSLLAIVFLWGIIAQGVVPGVTGDIRESKRQAPNRLVFAHFMVRSQLLSSVWFLFSDCLTLTS